MQAQHGQGKRSISGVYLQETQRFANLSNTKQRNQCEPRKHLYGVHKADSLVLSAPCYPLDNDKFPGVKHLIEHDLSLFYDKLVSGEMDFTQLLEQYHKPNMIHRGGLK